MKYDFKCNNDKCKVDVKEVECTYAEVGRIKCPECGDKMKKVSK